MRGLINAIDGIAIIAIVFSHAYYQPAQGILAALGLFLFTASSGFKLIYNHKDDLSSRDFIKQYAFRRIIRLYRPYLIYGLITMLALTALVYISKLLGIYKYLISFEQFNNIANNDICDILYNFLIGNPYGASQLWYLFTLLTVTISCLAMIYVFGGVKMVYLMIPPLAVADELVFRNPIIYYLLIFLFGMLLAQLFEKREIMTHSNPIVASLEKLGMNSFHIYLFQGPVVLPVIYFGLTILLHLPKNNIITSLICGTIGIIACLLCSDLLKRSHLIRLVDSEMRSNKCTFLR